VSTGPGQSTLTRIRGASSSASALVSLTTANFDAQRRCSWELPSPRARSRC
jgi:hypothetical protein